MFLSSAALLLSVLPYISVKKGPATDEIAALAKADQAARQFTGQPTTAEIERMSRGDVARENRIRQLLREDKVITKEDLDRAALIMQHGQDPDDFELARELSILSCHKGAYHSLPALAEDRFLNRIGRKQRFGSQFGWGPDGKPIIKDLDEAELAVTDAMRLDYLIPPIGLQRQKGLEAFKEIGPAIQKRIEQSRDKKWLAQAAKAPELARLEEIFRMHAQKDFDYRAVEAVVGLYRKDKLRTPQSLYWASSVLMTSSDDRTVLLANELAALAVMRGHAPAKKVFARSWDKFLIIIGRSDRYGTVSGAPKVSPIVEREFLNR